MQTVGIKALKNDLSRYIRAAEAGETVLVTDRNRVVAQLVPAGEPAALTYAEQQYRAMIREGILHPAKAPLVGPPPRSEPTMSFEELMRDLDESRADR